MTSFRANQIRPFSGYKGSFKVQCQIYYSLGPLLNTPGRDAQFVQIYFMDSSEMQVDKRCEVIPNLDKEVVASIQKMLHDNNCLITNFKMALEFSKKLTKNIPKLCSVSASLFSSMLHPKLISANRKNCVFLKENWCLRYFNLFCFALVSASRKTQKWVPKSSQNLSKRERKAEVDVE